MIIFTYNNGKLKPSLGIFKWYSVQNYDKFAVENIHKINRQNIEGLWHQQALNLTKVVKEKSEIDVVSKKSQASDVKKPVSLPKDKVEVTPKPTVV